MITKTLRFCVLATIFLLIIVGCEKKGTEITQKDQLVKDLLSMNGNSVAFVQSNVTGEFGSIGKAIKTEKEFSDVFKALKGKDESAVIKAMESKKIAFIALDADMSKKNYGPGSVLEAIFKAGELNLLSHVYIDSDVHILVATAKAFRISDAEMKEVIKYTREQIAGKKNASLPAGFNEDILGGSVVDLRFTDEQGYNKNLGLIRGNGKNAKLALDNAIKKAKKRYSEKGSGGFTTATVEEFVNGARITLNFHREKAVVDIKPGNISRYVELGLDGVVMSFNAPNNKKKVVVTPDKSKIYKAKSFNNLLEISCRKARLKKDEWQSNYVKFEKFRTFDISETFAGKQPIRLFRGAEYIDPATLDRAKIEESFRIGAEWILSILDEEKGMFKYEYYAVSDKYRTNRYNIIRHGLATLTLIQAYELFKEEKFLKGAKSAIEWVNDLMEWDGAMAYFHHPKYDSYYKLGGAGVMLQCMTEYYRFKKMPEWDKIMKGLAEFIMHMQKDNGHYQSYYIKPGVKDKKNLANKEVTIYPGEANLALVRMYNLFKDKRYLDTLEKAFKYYSEWFNDSKSPNRKGNLGAFVPWDMSAMMEYYDVTKNNDVATYGYQMADWLIDNWYAWGDKETYWKDFVGGIKGSKSKNNMPLWNSGVYGEGIASIYHMSVLKGDEDKRAKYRKAAFLTVRFIMNMQYHLGSDYYLPNTAAAIGAIPSTFHKDDCRLDYAYHCLTVHYRILRFFDDKDWAAVKNIK